MFNRNWGRLIWACLAVACLNGTAAWVHSQDNGSTQPSPVFELPPARVISEPATGDDAEDANSNASQAITRPVLTVTPNSPEIGSEGTAAESKNITPAAESTSSTLSKALRPSAGKKSDSKSSSFGFQPSNKIMQNTIASLAIVLGLFFLLTWFLKKNAPAGTQTLPREAVEVLGRLPFGAKQHLQLVRVGSKLVLVSVSQNGTEPICEITDPQQVEQLLAVCKGRAPGSMTESFRQMLDQVGREPASRGFLGSNLRA